MQWLSLSKNNTGPKYFVGEDNQPVNLFGMARCQSCAVHSEDPVYGGVDGICRHFKNLGCNFIRLAVDVRTSSGERGQHADYIEECGGYNDKGIYAFIDKYVAPEVEIIKQNGMYVMLDLHEYPPSELDDTGIVDYAYSHYIPIWRGFAEYFKDESAVAVYEIWNEPYPADISQALKDGPEWIRRIREFFFDAVKEIRKTDRRHIIMVSDYNAGWGMAWDNCWKDYCHSVDECKNTCFSIHLSDRQLEKEAPEYLEWLLKTADENNVCLLYGEVETEGGIATTSGIENLVKLIDGTKDTHHLTAVLWRPHDDKTNFVSVWEDFAKGYTTKFDCENQTKGGDAE